jgi:lipid II:glycine glycyltransferase (peptidoglycan interpeptide bridge formation enzyme)
VIVPASVSSRASEATASGGWDAWDEFLEGHPKAGFMQSSWWAEFRAEAGYEHFGAVLRHQGAILGGALVMTYSREPGDCFYYIPEGPVLPADEEAAAAVFGAVMDRIEARRHLEPMTVSHLRIEPRWERLPSFVRGFHAQPVLGDGYMEPRDTLCIDLRPPDASILAQMRPKGRYNIGVARRHGVSVIEDTSARGLEDFMDIYGATAARQGLRPKPGDYFESLVDRLASRQRGALFFAELHRERIAAALVVYCGPRATYFFGGSLDRYREAMAPYLLHFEIMRRARERGHEWYDFWGIAPPGEPDHSWKDFTAFKRKFGGVESSFTRTLDLVFDAPAYERYRSSW